jgi:phosphoserine phosphatase RsbU/P
VIRSINTKMLLLVFSILVITALVLMVFTKRDLEKEILEAQEKSLGNAIYLVKLNIENQYGSLLFHKMATLDKRKSEMKKLLAVVVSNVERYQRMFERGLVGEEEARLFALDWIRTLKCDEDSCFFVYDEQGVVLAHPNAETMGRNLSDLKDMKGVSLFQSMLQTTRTRGEGTSIFTWYCADKSQPSRKLGYFTYYAPLKWVIGTAVNVEDIEADAQKRLDAIIVDLRQTFGNVKIAQTGFLFLFSGSNQIIIDPPPTIPSLAGEANLLTGRPLLEDLKTAAKTPDTPVTFALKDPSQTTRGNERQYESYVQYFKTLDWYIASCTPKEEIMQPVRTAVFRQFSLIALIFVVSMAVTYFLVRRISQPLKKLTSYAMLLPRSDFTAPETGDEIKGLPARYGDEVGRLAEAFLFMEESLRRYIVNLRETTAVKERIESELKIASDIQMSILPKTFPPFPERPEFDIFAAIKPARQVGGDFYDFFFVDEEHLFFAIGDVAGKGVPASLFMAVTKTLLKANADSSVSPGEILKRVNDKLAEDNETCVFVTVFCGILDIHSGEVIYANGGHNPPMSIAAGEKVNFIAMPPGMALGVVEGIDYESASLTLHPGDVLFLYTDGVTEAMNTELELFSERRLKEVMASLRKAGIKEMSDQLMATLAEFAGSAPQADDITMLLVKMQSCVSGELSSSIQYPGDYS